LKPSDFSAEEFCRIPELVFSRLVTNYYSAAVLSSVKLRGRSGERARLRDVSLTLTA